MKPGTRRLFSYAPLVLQFLALSSAFAVLSFFATVGQDAVHDAGEKVQIPAVSRVLLEHVALAKLLLASVFAISVITFIFTRLKKKEEADQFAIQGLVLSITWYLGLMLAGGMIMAALLPYFAIHSTSP